MDTFSTVGFALIGLILGIGMSWAIVRRELTGRASLDEIEDSH